MNSDDDEDDNDYISFSDKNEDDEEHEEDEVKMNHVQELDSDNGRRDILNDSIFANGNSARLDSDLDDDHDDDDTDDDSDDRKRDRSLTPRRKHSHARPQTLHQKQKQKKLKPKITSSSDDAVLWRDFEHGQLYNHLKELELTYKCDICIPEFVFIGLQSAGKTSAVCQAARSPLGIMKDGTASRSPTRFKLVNNSNLARNKTNLYVNNEAVASWAVLTKRVLKIARRLEADDDKKFSEEIVEIRIESSDAPDLTFVDVPGLVTSNSKDFRKYKLILERITAKFLNARKNGRWQYMPILVHEVRDAEHETNEDMHLIDEIVCTYPNGAHMRTEWRDDALFIMNKFDRQLNQSSAEALIRNINRCTKISPHCVVTMLNAGSKHTAKLDSGTKLANFVRNVPKHEARKWQSTFGIFAGDRDLQQLKKTCVAKCGVSLMRKYISDKMYEIVRRIVPTLKRKLEAREQQLAREFASICEQIKNCDGPQLKASVACFNTAFINNLKLFYDNKLSFEPMIQDQQRLWVDELKEFSSYCSVDGKIRKAWSGSNFALSETALLKLLKISSAHGKPGGRTSGSRREGGVSVHESRLAEVVRTPLTGGAAIKRIYDVWGAMFAFMDFPAYSKVDINNSMHCFDGTVQPEMWMSVQRIVNHAASTLVGPSEWLAEMIRFRLKQDADVIFKFSILKNYPKVQASGDELSEFEARHSSNGDNTNQNQKPNQNQNQHRPSRSRQRRRRRQDKKLKTESDNQLMDDMNLYNLFRFSLQSYKAEVDKMLDEFVEISHFVPGDYSQTLDKMFCERMINLGNYINCVLADKRRILQPNHLIGNKLPVQTQHDPRSPGRRSAVYVESDEQAAADSGDDRDPDPDPDFDPVEAVDDNQDDDKDDEDEDEDIDDSTSDSDGDNIVNRVGVNQKKDIDYFGRVYNRNIRHPMVTHALEFSCAKILVLARAYYIGIKHLVCNNIQHKFSHRVMDAIRHDRNTRMVDAVRTGVQRKELNEHISKLVKLTGAPRSAFQALVDKAPMQIGKDIAHMTGDEVCRLYGLDPAKLNKQRDDKCAELNDFRLVMNQTLQKISS